MCVIDNTPWFSTKEIKVLQEKNEHEAEEFVKKFS